ncbi:MAG: GDYXXLXY domain-containing protein [Bacillaceae bacterium]
MKRNYYYGLVAIQVIIIVGLFTYQSLTSILGVNVELKASTYDPRDVLKGDYISLIYDIGWAPLDKWEGDEVYTKATWLDEEKKVYVVLKDDEYGYKVIDYVTDKKPKDNILYINAKLQEIGPLMDKETGLILQYGIEEYYVQENTGLKYEGKDVLTVNVYIWKGNIIVSKVSY